MPSVGVFFFYPPRRLQFIHNEIKFIVVFHIIVEFKHVSRSMNNLKCSLTKQGVNRSIDFVVVSL